MPTGLRVLLGLTAAASLALATPATASASLAPTAATASAAGAIPSIWRWGPLYSTDGMAEAKGTVAVHQFGFLVDGKLEDTRGKGCAWVSIRSMSAKNGRWRTASYYNCVPGIGTFRKDVGDVLQIKIRTCRGNSTRPTGWCSRWKTVYTQGG
ncbi:hypothetical protein [Nonomuraea sp. NPDC046570]|uniref:hypothetical protein n=1 Tax=Nonomuraea sp. NPDC046570 TaxID=3155255 RepID=UPI0033E06F74